jgi:hypothetical protein
VHHPLELWPVNQVEGALFSREHFQSYPPRRGDHPGSFLGRKITGSNGFEGKVHQDAQPANAATLFVYLFVRRKARFAIVGHGSLGDAEIIMDFDGETAQ